MKLRILNDLTGKSRLFDTAGEPLELLMEAKRLRRRVSKEQGLFKLCLHVTETELVMHWYAEDEKFANDLFKVADIINRTTAEILEGRVPA
jgi:hypothetical protein